MIEPTTRRAMLGLLGSGLATFPAMRLSAKAPSSAPVVVALTTATGRISMVTHWKARRTRGTILFSHGAASAPSKYDPLILPWVAAGYDVWAPLHVDSKEHPDTKKFVGLASWRARIEDMRALSAHVGTGPRIAAGHSYGALTALTLGGAAAIVPEGLSGPMNDPRVSAVVAFSPPAPMAGLITAEGYATLAVPALIETGDKDLLAGKASADPQSWKGHLTAYDAAAPGGDRYALVLAGVNHFFGGLICWLDQPGPPQTAQLETAATLAGLFIEAYGTKSASARRALDARLRDAGPVILRRK
ncbi:alpha/beta hydrolase family protein [Sphingomonas glacialis]|nr:alpha/beta fold hydrolase [Sphingomonas glacialis]